MSQPTSLPDLLPAQVQGQVAGPAMPAWLGIPAVPPSVVTECIPEALSVILRRASVRSFTDKRVSKHDIERILRAAMAAPAAVQQYPWKFVVIKNRDMLRFLASAMPHAKMLDEASVAIVVCAVSREAFTGSAELAVEALGLGAVWTTVYPKADLMQLLRIELGIPDEVIPLNIIPIGYPAGEDMPCNKYNPENIHWEEW